MTASPRPKARSKDRRNIFQRHYGPRLRVWRAIVTPASLLVLLLLLVRLSGLLQPVELLLYDQMLSRRPFEAPDPRITLVGITEEDIQALNHYPVNDTELAQVLRTLSDAQARIIGLDLFRDVPVQPGYDQLLKTYDNTPNLIAIEVINDTDAEAIIKGPARVPPERISFANFLEDKDWILRRMLLTVPTNDSKQAFSLRVATAYLQAEGYQLAPRDPQQGLSFVATDAAPSVTSSPSVTPAQSTATDPSAAPAQSIATASRHRLSTFQPHTGGYVREAIAGKAVMINYRQNPEPFALLTLSQVLQQQFDPELVRDRIVLIGNIAASSKDVFLTSGRRETLWSQSNNYSRGIPFSFGLEAHAHATSQLISRVLDRRWGIWSLPEAVEYGLIIVAGAVGTGLGLLLASPLGRLFGLALLSSALLLLSFGSLTWFGLWLPLVPVLLALTGAGFTTLFVDWELRLKLRQSTDTLERAYNAVHNGPLQTIAILLSQTSSQNEVHEQLSRLNQELRTIYESMKVGDGDGHQFLLGTQWLEAQEPLPLLLDQVYQLTVIRDFPGFDSIKIFMRPQLEALENCSLTIEQKKLLCAFLEEALCNVGKHARNAQRIDVVAQLVGKRKQRYCLQITDNGETPQRGLTVAGTPGRKSGAKYKSQGTRQMEALARELGGTFERLPNQPQGTLCRLSWPIKPPWGLRFRRFLRRI